MCKVFIRSVTEFFSLRLPLCFLVFAIFSSRSGGEKIPIKVEKQEVCLGRTVEWNCWWREARQNNFYTAYMFYFEHCIFNIFFTFRIPCTKEFKGFIEIWHPKQKVKRLPHRFSQEKSLHVNILFFVLCGGILIFFTRASVTKGDMPGGVIYFYSEFFFFMLELLNTDYGDLLFLFCWLLRCVSAEHHVQRFLYLLCFRIVLKWSKIR